jgi:hypothetical protein
LVETGRQVIADFLLTIPYYTAGILCTIKRSGFESVDHEIATVSDSRADMPQARFIECHASGNQLDGTGHGRLRLGPDEELPMLLTEMENLPTEKMSHGPSDEKLMDGVHSISLKRD